MLAGETITVGRAVAVLLVAEGCGNAGAVVAGGVAVLCSGKISACLSGSNSMGSGELSGDVKDATGVQAAIPIIATKYRPKTIQRWFMLAKESAW
jgi:hypothetical protein